jgi:hypothetical protein
MSRSNFEKSTEYPQRNLEDSIDFSNRVAKLGKKAAVGILSNEYKVVPTAKSFSGRLSSARQFGLIEVKGGVVHLTSLGDQLYMSEGKDVQELKISAFRSPKLFQKLILKYENKPLPTCEKLAYVLLDYGVTQKASKIAAEAFISTAEQLGLVNNGILDLNSELKEVNENAGLAETPENSKIYEPINDFDETLQPKRFEATDNYHKLEIPTENPGIAAQLLIPHNLTSDDIDFIEEMIKLTLKRYKKSIVSSSNIVKVEKSDNVETDDSELTT